MNDSFSLPDKGIAKWGRLLSPDARKGFEKAIEIAVSRSHSLITPAHIYLGFLESEFGPLYKSKFRQLHMDVDRLQVGLEQMADDGQNVKKENALQLQLNDSVESGLEFAFQEMQKQRLGHISPEFLVVFISPEMCLAGQMSSDNDIGYLFASCVEGVNQEGLAFKRHMSQMLDRIMRARSAAEVIQIAKDDPDVISDKAFEYFDEAKSSHYKTGEQDWIKAFEQRYQTLKEIRNLGIDKIPQEEIEHLTETATKLSALIRELMTQSNRPIDIIMFAREHPDVLDESGLALAEKILAAARQVGPEVAYAVEQRYKILLRCKEVGLERAQHEYDYEKMGDDIDARLRALGVKESSKDDYPQFPKITDLTDDPNTPLLSLYAQGIRKTIVYGSNSENDEMRRILEQHPELMKNPAEELIPNELKSRLGHKLSPELITWLKVLGPDLASRFLGFMSQILAMAPDDGIPVSIIEHDPLARPMAEIAEDTRFQKGISALANSPLENVDRVAEEYPEMLTEDGMATLIAGIYENWAEPFIGGLKIIAQCLESRVPELARILIQQGNAPSALKWMEQLRTRAFREFLAIGNVSREDVKPEDWSEFDKTRRKVHKLQIQQWATAESAISLLYSSPELHEARRALDSSVSRIRQYNPSFLPLTLSYNDIASASTSELCIVYLFTTIKGTFAVIIEPNTKAIEQRNIIFASDFTLYNLDAELGIDSSAIRSPAPLKPLWFPDQEKPDYVLRGWKLEKEKSGFVYELSQGNINGLKLSLDNVLPVLGKKIIEPLVSRLSELHVIKVGLIPCGKLSLLPFHAAPVENSYFGDLFEVHYLPSVRILLQSRNTQSSDVKSEPKFLTIIDPLHIRNKQDAFPQLQFAALEGNAITALAQPSRVTELKSLEATREKVLNLLQENTHIHFACHGIFYPSDTMRSGLALAQETWLQVTDILGRVQTPEFEPLLHSIRLMVLSACQTSIAEFNVAPDESLSLASICLLSGVPSVVGTLWSVNDLSTALLMIKFYDFYLNGEKRGSVTSTHPAEALRRAQQWLRNARNADVADLLAEYKTIVNDAPTRGVYSKVQEKFREHAIADPNVRPFEHPYYWAAFAFYGS